MGGWREIRRQGTIDAWTKEQIEVRHSVVEEAAHTLVTELRKMGIQRIIEGEIPKSQSSSAFDTK